MSLSGFERALLTSGKRDVPSSVGRSMARDAVLRAAGISSIAVAAAAAAAATKTTLATPASASAAGATSAGAATIKGLTLTKVVLILSALGASAGTVAAISRSTSISASVGNAEIAPTAQRPRTQAIVPAAPTSTASASVALEDHAAVPVVGINALPSSPSPAPSPSVGAKEDPIAIEARLLEGARACLAVGDRVCARARLAEYDKRFAAKPGALADEATVLAIDLAVVDGDQAKAHRLAAALLERKPNGAWSARARPGSGREAARANEKSVRSLGAPSAEEQP